MRLPFHNPLSDINDDILALATPMIWNPAQPYAFFFLDGIAPDPLNMGYSRPYGPGLGLARHRYIETTHKAAFWFKGGRERLGFSHWMGFRPLPANASAHAQLEHRLLSDRLTADAKTFGKALLLLPKLRALLAPPDSHFAVLFPPSTRLDSLPITLQISSPEHSTCIMNPGIPKPYGLDTHRAA